MTEQPNKQRPAPRPYHAYMLRIWHEPGEQGWRAMLEEVSSGERFGFATIGALYDFLAHHEREALSRSDAP